MKNLKRVSSALIIAFIASASYGQSLKCGRVVGIHEWNITLNVNVTPAKFENFMRTEYIPAFEKYLPGVQLFLAKGERGKNKDHYGLIVYFKDIEARNEWFPEPGTASERSKVNYDNFKPYFDKLNEMVTYQSVYTDWIIL
jgi:hypothetical protein